MHVLVIDHFPEKFLNALRQLPVSMEYLVDASPDEVSSQLGPCEILIMNSKIRMDRETAPLAPNLKMVIRAGVGMDHIDVEYLESQGILVRNTKGGNADAVGEQTLGMLLALRNNIHLTDRQVRKFEWKREENRGSELTRKTVGIIGYGNTGSAVGKRLAGFGCKVLAYDKYKSGFGHDHVEESTLEGIYEQVDILTLHVPLTDETRHWINPERIAGFDKPFMLLNLARGPVVDFDALIAALDRGQITGAALDVFPNEKLHTLTPTQRGQYENLFARENVILSPHIGGWTHESLENINGMILEFVRGMVE